jgi:hypothetical protein
MRSLYQRRHLVSSYDIHYILLIISVKQSLYPLINKLLSLLYNLLTLFMLKKRFKLYTAGIKV